MDGVWIDAKTKEIVRIEGDIFHPVNWGWGMLAHIYPGGKVDLEQTAASGARWNMTSFHEQVTVKALMVKTLSVHNEGQSFSFQALPEGDGVSGCDSFAAEYGFAAVVQPTQYALRGRRTTS